MVWLNHTVDRIAGKKSHRVCVFVFVWKNWFTCSDILGNLPTPCVCVCRTVKHVFMSVCKSRHLMFQCKVFILRGSIYYRASIYVHSPDTPQAVCQMSCAYVSYVKMCISHVCVCVLPLWLACLWYWVLLSALQMLLLTLLDCSPFIMWARFRHPAAAVMD